MKHFTEKQLRAQKQFRDIVGLWNASADSVLLSQTLSELEEVERSMLLRRLFWHALETSDWKLATFCVTEGVTVKSDLNDLSDWGSIRVAMDRLGDRPDVVKWLLEHGAEVDRRGWLDWTPLMYAAWNGFGAIVNALVANGADVNAYSEVDQGCSPLSAAQSGGHQEIVQFLIENGATK